MTVFCRSFDAPDVSFSEIYRYMRQKTPTDEIKKAVERELSVLLPQLTYRVCYCEEECKDGAVLMSRYSGKTVTKYIGNSERAIVFAATVGIAPDRLVARYSSEPLRALAVQAIGAERAEALCDCFCRELKAKYETENIKLSERFSPGYGDFPLEAQRDIFSLLDCARKINLTLNESLLMSPTKSVTALIGLKQI